ncbi:MAG: GGDEF/EAL/PAS/PAC/GAF-domain containing protein, partial [Frankiales bacterium]|nr:GGDEF/EAL/PAS/PAC/GAF-domain containing protein [Frankiales bacterium]
AAGRAALAAVRAPLVLPRVEPGSGAWAEEADADLAHWVLARGYPDLVAAPVLVGGDPVGVLAVSGRRRGAPRLDRADAELVGALAEQVGVLLAASRVARKLTAAEASRSELEQRVFTDDLTGLARRPLFVDRIMHAASQRGASGSLAVLYLDLDDFKAVNDRLGHAAGDAVLIAVAQRIAPLLRAGDTACRLGGDEFAVLLTGLDGADRAALVASRLLDALRVPVPVPGGSVHVRASVGIVVAEAGDDVASLLADADAAMYDAKRTGGDRWAAAERKPSTAARSNVALGRTQQIVSALSQPRLPGTLEVHYQPYVDLASGTVAGVEALVRWHHPDLGLLSPAEFLPVAERLGRMAGLGREVLDSAVHQLARWDAAGAPPLRLNVNLSASQLRDPGLVESVEDALLSSGLAPDRLVLEVSEGAIGQDPHEVVPVMALLAGRGVRWSLDGFGTGAVPLSRLDLLPLESVKIPAGMLADERHPGRLGLTEGMVRLARSLGLRVVAEGVEREAQVVLLRGMRCDQAQGFHYGRPEPAGAGSPAVR